MKTAILLFACLVSLISCDDRGANSSVPPARTDTTSHSYDWQVEKIGTRSGQIYDVEALSDNEVYVCGRIKFDSTGTIGANGRIIEPFNVARKLHDTWTYYLAPSPTGAIGSYEFYSIKIFNLEQVWICSAGGFVIYQNGRLTGGHTLVVNRAFIVVGKFFGWYYDLYIPKAPGSMYHYNRGLISVISYPVADLIAAGFEHGDEIIFSIEADDGTKAMILKKDGTMNIFDVVKNQSATKAVWCDERGVIYFCGVSGMFRYDHESVTKINIGAGLNDVRGRAWNDIYAVGSASRLYHFNGATWREIGKRGEWDYVLNKIALSEKNIFITAYNEFGEFLITGKRR